MSLAIIAKGMLTFVLPPSFYNRSGGRTHSARYCYSVYLRHRAKIAAAGLRFAPKAVAEIGPGESIGAGLVALAAGAESYLGFDVKDYGRQPASAALFDEAVELLRHRAAVPGENEFPNIKPALDNEAFPEAAFGAELDEALSEDRIARLRGALGGPETPARYVAPWNDPALMKPGSVDWIFSQAVMEHVDDLDGTYAACFDWLRPGGLMSHQIDLKCHGTARVWNGHWGYSDLTWRMIRGGRLYLINRAPLSAHLAAMVRAGFEIVDVARVERRDGLSRDRLAARFNTMRDDDLCTAGAFVLARKPETLPLDRLD